MIEIKNMSFGYNRRKRLFNQLDLSLEPGNIYGLLGRNGAGKTTLLRMIAGLIFPDRGICTINGHKSADRLPETMQQIYMIPEEYQLPAIRISRYVSLNAPFYERFDQGKFLSLLQEFQLRPEYKLHQLSYGQKKKFLLAFGLSTNASLLLMDEPTNGLDIPSKSQFRKVIAASFAEDQVLLISTHQVRDLESLIDPVIIIDEGKIIFHHSVEEITGRLNFEVSSEKGRALYSEEVFGGYAAILPNLDGKQTRLDIELLFNGVISNAKEINQAFENQ
jgi:ABC-2 type transport system ATP-binding protein